MRALGWRWDSDPWSWRRGSSAEVEELGAERYRGRTMAVRDPRWRLRRSAVSPPPPAEQGARCRIKETVEMMMRMR